MKAKNAVVGVWSTTERRSLSVLARGPHGRRTTAGSQVSRLGNPLINEVVIPIGKKDKFNATSPSDDAKNFGDLRAEPGAGARCSTRCSASASRRTTARTSCRRCSPASRA